jgi:hypothetical protein
MAKLSAGQPPARDLDRTELRELVTRVAADPDQWRHLVRYDAAERHFEQLWRDEHVDVWVISRGAVAVVEGELVEERLALVGTPREIHHGAGGVFDFDASHVHRMRHDVATPAVSIHAYSPPLWRMGAYTVDADGTLRRESISYVEELRSVETAA